VFKKVYFYGLFFRGENLLFLSFIKVFKKITNVFWKPHIFTNAFDGITGRETFNLTGNKKVGLLLLFLDI